MSIGLSTTMVFKKDAEKPPVKRECKPAFVMRDWPHCAEWETRSGEVIHLLTEKLRLRCQVLNQSLMDRQTEFQLLKSAKLVCYPIGDSLTLQEAVDGVLRCSSAISLLSRKHLFLWWQPETLGDNVLLPEYAAEKIRLQDRSFVHHAHSTHELIRLVSQAVGPLPENPYFS